LHFPNKVALNESVLTNMKTPVGDAAVDVYVDRILAGGPLGKVFPGKLSECDFTPAQREKIRKARADKRASQKRAKSIVAPLDAKPNPKLLPGSQPKSPKTLTKMRKMLYLQGGNCFFCGTPLSEDDASIEHLNPKSRGGPSSEDNEVVCHRTLNHAFGNMLALSLRAHERRTAVDLHHLPEGTHSLASRPGALAGGHSKLVGVGRLALPRLFEFESNRSAIPDEPHAGRRPGTCTRKARRF
jgi:5-methylcytosine-specific restriction endonuclease McrA